VAVYTPKGDEEGDLTEVVRTASGTLPIGLKNSDDKIVCGAWNYKLRGLTQRESCRAQRGFVPGRLAQNPTDMDVAARIYGVGAGRADKPVLAVWGFKSAFPSLSHAWIHFVIAALGLPQGLLNLSSRILAGRGAL
jgi:hypothetical protein